jgi:hypothetical protein
LRDPPLRMAARSGMPSWKLPLAVSRRSPRSASRAGPLSAAPRVPRALPDSSPASKTEHQLTRGGHLMEITKDVICAPGARRSTSTRCRRRRASRSRRVPPERRSSRCASTRAVSSGPLSARRFAGALPRSATRRLRIETVSSASMLRAHSIASASRGVSIQPAKVAVAQSRTVRKEARRTRRPPRAIPQRATGGSSAAKKRRTLRQHR